MEGVRDCQGANVSCSQNNTLLHKMDGNLLKDMPLSLRFPHRKGSGIAQGTAQGTGTAPEGKAQVFGPWQAHELDTWKGLTASSGACFWFLLFQQSFTS